MLTRRGKEGKERGLRLSPGAAAAPAALHKAQCPLAMPAPWQRSPAGSSGSSGAISRLLPAGPRSPRARGRQTLRPLHNSARPPPAAPLTCAAITCPNSSLHRCPGKGDYSTGLVLNVEVRARIPQGSHPNQHIPGRDGDQPLLSLRGHHTDGSHNC